MTSTHDYVQWFRQSAPYINTHRHKTFVILLAGEALLHDNFQNIIHDLGLLHALGIRLVLVHGARPQINDSFKNANITAQFHQQRRITPRASLPYLLNAVG
ncbi:MAG: amino-acid N-acetyltransferase, partial [Acinetobacter sp.]|nr:amino-acid N-acetyltransferase [Acinetobacter sp.]